MSQKTILYEDKSVKISPDDIEIFEYYFPLPINKTINMCDVKQVNLKTDINKHEQYLQIIVKSFSMNATFSPLDPKKCLQIIRSHSSFDLAGKNLSQANTILTSDSTGLTGTDVQTKVEGAKEDIKKGAKEIKQQGDKKWKQGKRQVKEELNRESGVIQNVTATLSQGWEQLKEVSHNLYEATTKKIHEMTAPQTEQKAREAKQDFKEGVLNIKEFAKDTKWDVEKKAEKVSYEAKKTTGMQPQKTVYENVKEGFGQSWENVKEGAQNVYDKAAQKVSETVGTDAESIAKQAQKDFKSGAQNAKKSLEKATGFEKPLTQQTKEKVEQVTGTDATDKAKSAKEHFKQGTQDLGDSAKKATGYEGSALEQAKQNVAEGFQSTKKNTQNVYDNAAKKLSQMGSSAQQTIGQKTKQAGEALKEKGNKMQKNA